MAQKGRKVATKDDPKFKLLIQALQSGNYVETACLYAGLAPSTVYRWVERGRNERDRQEQGLEPNPVETPYVELCEAVEKARANAVVANVAIIQQAARTGTWQAAAWWLERTMPNQFGRKIQAEVTTTVSVQDLERRMLELIGESDSGDIQEADA
jgi:transposase-like protein